MDLQEIIQRSYMVTVSQTGEPMNYQISYVPRGLFHERGPGGASKQMPLFRAMARVHDDEIVVHWDERPPDPEAAHADYDQDVRARVDILRRWTARLIQLVSDVSAWAEELGWVTRKVDKPMRDKEIGDYKAPGLVLQRDLTRVGLEPIGRASPGTEGVVDLYLMPAYDDIASLYYYGDGWNLHYRAQGTPAAESIPDAASKPLTKETLRDVLDQITTNV